MTRNERSQNETRSRRLDRARRQEPNEFLILAGMLTVALIFGISFYFALLSNQSALARQFPELEEVAVKLRSILMLNTAVFAAIIIASFVLLASIVTSRHVRTARGAAPRPRSPSPTESSPAAPKRAGRGVFRPRNGMERRARMHPRKEIRRNQGARRLRRFALRAGLLARSRESCRRSRSERSRSSAPRPHPEALEKETNKDPLFIQPI